MASGGMVVVDEGALREGYEWMSTDALLGVVAVDGLTDQAHAVVVDILRSRGVEVAPRAAVTAARREARAREAQSGCRAGGVLLGLVITAGALLFSFVSGNKLYLGAIVAGLVTVFVALGSSRGEDASVD